MTRPASSYKVSEKDAIISDIVSHYTVYRSLRELTQFQTGFMATLSMRDLFDKHPHVGCSLLMAQSNKLASHRVQDLLSPEYSDKGTNRRMVEEEQIMNLFSFIEKCNGMFQMIARFCTDYVCLYMPFYRYTDEGSDITLQDLLLFLTGTDTIPPMGFESKITVLFTDDKCLPSVNTCALKMYLPLTPRDEEEFDEMFRLSIVGSVGFGNA